MSTGARSGCSRPGPRTHTRLETEIEPGWRNQIALLQVAAAAALPRAVRAASAHTHSLGLDRGVRAQRGGKEPAQHSPTGPVGPLTARERAVADLVAQGPTDRQIGGSLRISHQSPGTYLNRIRRKLRLAPEPRSSPGSRNSALLTPDVAWSRAG
jgi:DNA-binding CsgD family transcriptional regulator